jgi:hypothetical protein
MFALNHMEITGDKIGVEEAAADFFSLRIPPGFTVRTHLAPEGKPIYEMWDCTIPGPPDVRGTKIMILFSLYSLNFHFQTDWEGGNYPLRIEFHSTHPYIAPRCP